MATQPRLLDLFCGAGGAAVGYHRAGFDVVGVDIASQKNYPFEFHQADALTFPLDGFDAIHASPPCQRDSAMSVCRPGLAATYPALIEPIRKRLQAQSAPWVIENVPGAPLRNPLLLCGSMFDLDLYRHRLFECSFTPPLALHPPHGVPGSRAGHWKPGQIISVSGNCAPIKLSRKAMGISWMNRDELSEAIPPVYTEYVGEFLIHQIPGAATAGPLSGPPSVLNAGRGVPDAGAALGSPSRFWRVLVDDDVLWLLDPRKRITTIHVSGGAL